MLSLLTLFCTAIGVGMLLLKRRGTESRRVPPGPSGLPFFGNAFQIPKTKAWLYYTDLYKQYGDIIQLTALGKPIIILNTAKAANDLFVKRAHIYSDRPQFVMVGELVGFNKYMAFVPYGNLWRTQRRLFHQYLSKMNVQDFYPELAKEACSFVQKISISGDIFSEFRLSAARNIFGATYGMDVKTWDDPVVSSAEEAMRFASECAVPGAFLVDMIPALKYVPNWSPGAGFKRYAEKGKKIVQDSISIPYKQVQRQVLNGTAKDSFASRLLEADGCSDEVKMMLSGQMYHAGSDTTWGAVMRFFLAMTLYPDVQRKAQAELDSIVGSDRLPDLNDKGRLPYLDCILKELYRWEIMLSIGLPHRLMEDDEYEGFHLAKGATIIGNAWAISMDPVMYPDPERFNPDRFLPVDGNEVPMDPRTIAFGYGRRICAGIHFAELVIWSTVATILATLDISKALDADGKPITPVPDFVGELIRQPKPFPCRVEVRSPLAFALVQEAAL